MNKIFLLIIMAIVLTSCGNKKDAEVSKISDKKVHCTTTKKIGSNIPTKVCN